MSELETRRKKVFKQMNDHSVAIFFSGLSKISSEDEFLPFCVNKNFYYLTNIEQEHSILVLIKALGDTKTYLFVDPYNELKEKWTGKRLTFDHASLISDIKTVYSSDNFATILDMYLHNENNQYGNIDNVYLDLTSPEQKIAHNVLIDDYAETLRKQYENKKIIDIYPILRDLRMVKSPNEIQNIVKAIEKTNNGIIYLLNKMKAGVKEYELNAHFTHYGKINGNTNLAFSTIVASGKNATCLHYPSQEDLLKENDLVLFDLGYRHEQYCADISRTFPVSGKFVGKQVDVYQAVLAANKAVIQYAKAGVTISQLNDLAKQVLCEKCLELGLMNQDEDISKYYYHNVSHHLGLDTHDVALRDKPLEKGNVITVEPGLYFAKYNIGVRIEDDILINEDNATLLSKNIVKEIEDIEALMTKREK